MSKIDVLLVEDADTDADLTEYRLKRSGHPVRVYRVRDGDECMKFLRDPNAPYPDLIFLDLNMPIKDGREVLGEMRVDPDLDRLVVVVMSSSDLEEDREKAASLGANSYVVKPGTESEFTDLMKLVDQYWLGINRYPPKRKKIP